MVPRPPRTQRGGVPLPPAPPAYTPPAAVQGDGWQRRRRRPRRASGQWLPTASERLTAAAATPSTRSAVRSRARRRALAPALEGAVIAASTSVAEVAALLSSLRQQQLNRRRLLGSPWPGVAWG